MSNKPKIDPAEGWAMLIAPKVVGDIVAVTAELQDPSGRTVASVVVERPSEGGLEAATRAAGKLLKEMVRLGDAPTVSSREPRTSKAPVAKPPTQGTVEFPDPNETIEKKPLKVAPLNRQQPAIEDRPLVPDPVKTTPDLEPDAPPTEGDIQALEDACESEGVAYVKPSTHREAIDWMVGLREGRYDTLPPTIEDVTADQGEEVVNA